MTLDDLVPLKFSPLTTLLTHWMHLPSTPLCLVLPMNSSTFFTINFLHTFFICSRPNGVAELFPLIYCWPSWPYQCSVMPSFSHRWVSRVSVTGLSFCPLRTSRSRRCLEWPPWLGSSFCLSFRRLPFSRSSLSCLHSGTSITLLCFSSCSLHPLCSTLILALLPLYLLLLLRLCRSRGYFSLFARRFPCRSSWQTSSFFSHHSP